MASLQLCSWLISTAIAMHPGLEVSSHDVGWPHSSCAWCQRAALVPFLVPSADIPIPFDHTELHRALMHEATQEAVKDTTHHQRVETPGQACCKGGPAVCTIDVGQARCCQQEVPPQQAFKQAARAEGFTACYRPPARPMRSGMLVTLQHISASPG